MFYDRRWAHKQEGVEDLMEKAKDVVASGNWISFRSPRDFIELELSIMILHFSWSLNMLISPDRNEYASEKVNTCTASVKDNGEELYDEANHKVEEAYNMVRKSGLSEEAKVMYEAAKERASDVAGEVGAKIGHQ